MFVTGNLLKFASNRQRFLYHLHTIWSMKTSRSIGKVQVAVCEGEQKEPFNSIIHFVLDQRFLVDGKKVHGALEEIIGYCEMVMLDPSSVSGSSQ